MLPNAIPALSEKQKAQFYKRVPTGSDGCWEWTGSRNRFGYGCVQMKTRRHVASRVAYFLHYGVDPGQLFVCHKCDNPPCVNPDHLFLGEPKANTADCINKGRFGSPKGEQHFFAKLSSNIVREIRLSDQSNGQLARLYGVSVSAVQRARTGKNWASVDDVHSDDARKPLAEAS